MSLRVERSSLRAGEVKDLVEKLFGLVEPYDNPHDACAPLAMVLVGRAKAGGIPFNEVLRQITLIWESTVVDVVEVQ